MFKNSILTRMWLFYKLWFAKLWVLLYTLCKNGQMTSCVPYEAKQMAQ